MTHYSVNSSNYISTILEVTLSSTSQVFCFHTISNLSIELGRKIAYQFSAKNSTVKAVYEQGNFWLLSHPSNTTDQTNWQEDYNAIAQRLRPQFGYLDLTLTPVDFASIPASIISQLARVILSTSKQRLELSLTEKEFYQIYRQLEVIPESFFPNQAGIALNWKTSIKPTETIKDYWLRHNKDEGKLLKLAVKNRFINRTGVIDSIIGTCKTERDRLLSYDLIPKTREIIQNSDDEDLVVSVKQNNTDSYGDYVIDGLELSINPKNCHLIGLDQYESYRKLAKISLAQWTDLLEQGKKFVQPILRDWGIQVSKDYVNSIDNQDIFFHSNNFQLDTVQLLFGKGKQFPRDSIKKGLKQGGVFSCHQNFAQEKTIKTVALKLCKDKAKNLLNELTSGFKQVGFQVEFIKKIPIEVSGQMSEDDVAKIDSELERAIALQPDLFLTILPEGDQQLDDTSQGSYYHHISQQLLKQGIPSQMIKVENLNNRYIINNLVLGILAKLGNLPFVLAQPLKVADCFLGLDVARLRKSKGNGTQNACACVRLYGKQGEFIKYYLEQDRLEGEEVTPKILRKLTPSKDLADRTVLMFRDGRFRGKEIEFLNERGKANNTNFIFVEVTKTKTCRLFNYQLQDGKKQLQIPNRFLIFRHSNRAATVVTTQPQQSVGIANPIRITIREEGVVPEFKLVLEATFKLCLLHHGSYQEPRLPVPIYASDMIGYKTLKGLYHTNPEGDCQWWL